MLPCWPTPNKSSGAPGSGEKSLASSRKKYSSPLRSFLANMKTFVLGGGCFWCLDAVYQQTRGVKECISGYTGGSVPHPDYYSVAAGTTGHAEVVAVAFDESIVPSDVILGLFFLSHDPTSLNRQGYDVGTQYRSSMFYADEQERDEFVRALDKAQANWEAPIVTKIEPLGEFYAEGPEHQDFYSKHPFAGYCQVIINPKLAKARKEYADWVAS